MSELIISGAAVARSWRESATPADLLIDGGRITAVLPAGEAPASSAGRRVHLDGAVIGPTFADGHVHPAWAGLEMSGAPVREASDVAEVVAAVRSFAELNPHLDWLVGGSYDPTLAPEGLFDARWLDEASPDRPVALTSSDHHCLWVNTRALDLAGITADTAVPAGGEIPLTSTGRVLGTLREWEAMSLVTRLLPRPDRTDRVRAIAAATAALADRGVGWVLDAAVTPQLAWAYLEAAESSSLRTRVSLALRANPEDFEVAALVALAQEVLTQRHLDAAGDPWVTARTVKFFADGVVEAGTAAMLEPYADQAHDCGLPVWPDGRLTAAVAEVEAAGLDVHIHAIGDGGIRLALDALAASPGRRDPRRSPTIAHVQVLHPTDRGRFAELGVTANFEPLWACWDPCQRDLTAPRLGPVRTSWQYPMRTMLDSGANVSFGSDWPVSDFDPLTNAAVAVTRSLGNGESLAPTEAITATEALVAATSGVARQAGRRDLGDLVPGARADLVVLSQDPRTIDAAQWAGIDVLGRVLAGMVDD